MKTVPDSLFANPNIEDERDAIFWDDAWISYRTFRGRVRQLADALFARGIKKGDRVAILLNNRPEFLECYYAITSIGALVVPLNARLSTEEHLTILVDADPSLLISSPDFEPTVSGFVNIYTDDAVVMLDHPVSGRRNSYEAFISAPNPSAPPVSINPDDDAAIIYTSGTTANPKGAVLTHKNYLSDWYNVGTVYQQMKSGTNLQISPLYHASAVHSLIHIAVGARTILMKRFDCDLALSLIEQHKVTHFFCVPTVLYDFLDNPRLRKTDTSSLRSISYGAAPMSLNRLEEALDAFGPILVHAYGMTETTSHSSLLSGKDHLSVFGSVGRPLPLCDMKIVDSDGNPVPAGEPGEILIRGDNVMSRYWRRPTETAEAFEDGWLHSGDIGKQDESGFFFVVDRKKDMIISGGVNIYPKDIEQVIAQYPAVGEVAVFGVSDARWGEVVVATVRARPDHVLASDDLLAFLTGKIGRFQLPKFIYVVDDFPRNGTGKILKHVLRSQYKDAAT